MALPDVEETSHFRFHVPAWKVRGKTFLGMGQDETTAVFCIGETAADEAAAADPASYEAVRRQDARRSFLGLQAELGRIAPDRARELVELAWRQQAPKRLAAGYDRGGSAL
jgi:hypothetical protein